MRKEGKSRFITCVQFVALTADQGVFVSQASSGYRSSTPPHSRQSSRVREDSTYASWRRTAARNNGSHASDYASNHVLRYVTNRAYWSDDGAEYESQY